MNEDQNYIDLIVKDEDRQVYNARKFLGSRKQGRRLEEVTYSLGDISKVCPLYLTSVQPFIMFSRGGKSKASHDHHHR